MKLVSALVATASLVTATAAFAQDRPDLRVRVGLGGQYKPKYIGADDSQFALYPKLSIAKDGELFKFSAPDDNFSIKLVRSGGLSFGPTANIEGSRKNKDVGAAVGKVPTTIEAGAFVQYDLGDSFRFRSEVRKGIGGHEGIVANVGADYIRRDGDKYVFSIGPRLLLSNGRYQRAWFGVDPEAAIATGLPAFRPGGGVHAVAATTGLTRQLNDDWGLFGFARYERLVGDAARSPLIKAYGSKNQASAGVGLSYVFRVKR